MTPEPEVKVEERKEEEKSEAKPAKEEKENDIKDDWAASSEEEEDEEEEEEEETSTEDKGIHVFYNDILGTNFYLRVKNFSDIHKSHVVVNISQQEQIFVEWLSSKWVWTWLDLENKLTQTGLSPINRRIRSSAHRE